MDTAEKKYFFFTSKGLLHKYVLDYKQRFEALVLPTSYAQVVLKLVDDDLGHNRIPHTSKCVRSSSITPGVNNFWFVLMNILVLQSFSAVSTVSTLLLLIVSIVFQHFNCIYCMFNSHCTYELLSHIWTVCWLKDGWSSNCDSMVHEGSLLLLECLLTPTVYPVWQFGYVLPVLGVTNKDCT